MGYARFFREAEPHKISRCGHCGGELRRNQSVWVLLGAMIVFVALSIALAYPLLIEWPLWLIIIAGLVFLVVVLFATNFIGWKFVGWRKAGNGG